MEATNERRKVPRYKFTGLVRIRPVDPQFPPEVGTTSNISPNGLYFLTSAGHYRPGMQVYVTREFQPDSPAAEETAAVVRVDRLETGQCGVAIRVLNPPTSPIP